jgi:hypothetical protein
VLASALAWWALRGIDHRFISFSDGVYMYAASVAAEHGAHALYNTVALSLPPGVPLATSFLWRLSPHIETVRLALAGLSLLTALLAYNVARTLFSLGRRPAILAAAVALTAPVAAQFDGLEGEAVLTPLALAVALAIARRRLALSTALLAAGFVFKLTWAPFFLAGVVALAVRSGKRRALTAAAAALAVGALLYVCAALRFGWSAGDLLAQLVYAESHSDLQLGLLPGVSITILLLWWPLLALAGRGFRAADGTALLLALAGAASFVFMIKQGTFFNVLSPLEPFLAVAAVAGGVSAWSTGATRMRVLVVACALGVAIHAASVSTGAVARALPFPLGAAVVDVDNEQRVDRLAGAIAAHSRPDQPVLVNPLFALVAGREEPAYAADWFILRALQRYCGANTSKARHCRDWAHVKALARSGRVAAVTVDTNVVAFDASFRTDVGVGALRRVLRVDAPPIKSALYVP